MYADSLIVLKWWLYILLLGVIFLPITQKYFGRFFDKGYSFSKVIAIAVSGYIVWLLSALKLAAFSRTEIFIVLLVLVCINVYIIFRRGKSFLISGKLISIYAAEEVIFLILLLFWSYIRGIKPDIYGLEKFMDFGFVNAVLRAEYMPPIDIWFAGKGINYYYFGHYICAFLTKLTAIPSAVTYNLMLATILAQAFTLSFSLVSNMIYCMNKDKLRKALIAGLISAFMVSFAGNLHGFVYSYAKPFVEKNITHTKSEYSYFYPHSTRYIGHNPQTEDRTIHEFPIYSFVVSDLHGHVSDIPYVITFAALMFAFWESRRQRKGLDVKTILLGSLFLSVMYMTNAWDYPIYATVALGVIIAYAVQQVNSKTYSINQDNLKHNRSLKYASLIPWATFFSFLILSQILLLPFNMSFDMISNKIAFVWSRTPFYQLLVLWGHQLFFALCFTAFIIRKIVLYCNRPCKHEDTHKGFPGLLKFLSASDTFCFILVICAVGLIILPEVVFVKDIYQAKYHRANTMFKLVYQAFILFGLAIGYISVRLMRKKHSSVIRLIISVVFIIMLVLPMLYPAMAVKGYYGSIKPSNYKGLNGLSFLERTSKGDFDAVQWLNANVNGQQAILEANGDSYSDYCRISMATGLPTIQGWYVHEWLWRNSSELPKERAAEVATVYESADIKETLTVLRKYMVKYIIIGDLEKKKFANINIDKLLSLGDVVFDSEKTIIIETKDF